MLLVADHVFDPAILRRLLGRHVEEGEIVLAVDFRVDDVSVDGLVGLTRSWVRLERLHRRTEPPPGLRPR